MQEIRRFKPSTVSRRFSVAAGFYRTCVIDGVLEHSPAEHVRRPTVPAESPTLGFTHLRFEALLTAACRSAHPCGFALVAMAGLPGLRIFEGHRRGHRRPGRRARAPGTACVRQGTKIALIPLPPAAGRAIDRAMGARASGPILPSSRGARMDRHAAARRLRRLAEAAGVPITRPHPHMLRHAFVTTMVDAGSGLRDVQIAARHAGPRTTMRCDGARKNLGRHPHDILAASMAAGTRPGALAIAANAYSIRCMAGLYEIGIEPEVRSWLALPSDRDFGRAGFLAGLLAEHAEDLGEPCTRHLAGKVRELRFHLLPQQTRVTYWLAPGRRVV